MEFRSDIRVATRDMATPLDPLAFAVGIVKAIIVKVSWSRQRLGDRLVGTIVIRRSPELEVTT